MRRLFWRALGIVVALLVVAIVALVLALRGSLPRYDGRVTVAAQISAPCHDRARCARHGDAARANRRDLSWALGYVHAQERFFEMDLLRRRAAGELAELFGRVALPADRTARAHRMRARAQRSARDRLPAHERDESNAYRDGVERGPRRACRCGRFRIC